MQDRLGDIRLVQRPAVDDRAEGRDQLNRRDGNALAETRRRLFQQPPIVAVEQDALGFARQIDAGFLTEAEGVKIFTQIVAAQHLGDVHKAGIGRILQALHIGLLTMTAGFPRL